MKIIGAGFGRTGTESTAEALEILLGGKCYHMNEVRAHPEHLERWYAFGRAGRTGMDWKALLTGYEAAVDWPICNYYRELMAAFPEAKVLLTDRDAEKWYDSFMNLVRVNAVVSRLRFLVPKFQKFATMIDTAVWHIFPDRYDRAQCIAVYKRHVEEVKRTVPPERLLVFRVQEGWEPLCRFLGVPVPDRPFPHRNTGEQFRRMFRRELALEILRSPATLAAVLALFLIAAVALL